MDSDHRREESQKELVDLIHLHFAYEGVPPPGPTSFYSLALDLREDKDNPFEGKRWQDVTADDLFYDFEDALFLFDDNAYRYFLPAFMKYSLRCFEKEADLTHYVVAQLDPILASESERILYRCQKDKFVRIDSPDGSMEISCRFIDRNQFSMEQVEVICGYLLHLSDFRHSEYAKKTYEIYWRNKLAELKSNG